MNVSFIDNETIWRTADGFRLAKDLAGHDMPLEDQADEFAGRFLVPPGILQNEYDRFQRKLAAADPAWHEIEGMRTHLAKTIAPRFGVNYQVIETRFAREGIWPLE